MKIILLSKKQNQAGALIVTLLICSVLAFSVLGYLSVIEQQDSLGRRSQFWNYSMTVAEAGIEEGLAHLNANYANLGVDGWTLIGGAYIRTNTFSDGSMYIVSLTNWSQPTNTILSQSLVKASNLAQNSTAPFFATIGVSSSSGLVSRAVQVCCYRRALYTKAMAARDKIDLKGNGIFTDSFDSEDLTRSINGMYDSTRAGDKGDVASNDTIASSISVQNANIYGHAATGPGGTVTVGSQGAVGSHAWQSGNRGFQPGWVSADSNFTFPDTTLPYTSGLTPTSGKVDGTHYDNILSVPGGKYYVSQLSGSTLVLANVELVVGGNISMSGNDIMKIKPGGSMTNWVGGTAVTIGGNGIVNETGYAKNYVLLAALSVTSFTLNGNGTFAGVLVAPNAEVKMNGGGNSNNDFVGSLMGSNVTMNGHFSFHYDEALGRIPSSGRFLISSWDEIAVNTTH